MKKGGSLFWKGFAETLKFINENIGWIIGNGEKISVWKCNWIPSIRGIRKPFSPTSNPNVVIKDLLDDNKSWNMQKIKEIFSDPRDVEEVSKIYISHLSDEDKRIWPHSKSGEVTTKSAFNIINKAEVDPLVASTNWKHFWKLPLPQRILLFGWKCLRGAIPVRSILKSRFGLANFPSQCTFSEEKEETIVHILFHCEFSRAVWFGSHLGALTHNFNRNNVLD